MKVRSIYRAALVENAIAPYNSILLKVFYPATLELTPEALNFGIVPVNKTNAPFPVVIFFSGVNVDAGSYHDLAVEMAEKGLVFITFDWVTNTLPGNHTGLTPGVDLKNMTPENIAKFPTGLAVQSILNELENINKDSLLQGLLDLDKIIFGGHSAGGSIALLNANPDFFPQVIGAFAYGAHTQGATMLGFAPETFIPLSVNTPFLKLARHNQNWFCRNGQCLTKLRHHPCRP